MAEKTTRTWLACANLINVKQVDFANATAARPDSLGEKKNTIYLSDFVQFETGSPAWFALSRLFQHVVFADKGDSHCSFGQWGAS